MPTTPSKALQGEFVFQARLEARRHPRETGSVKPKPQGGGAVAKVGVEPLPIIAALVTAQPDARLTELWERVAKQTGVNGRESTMQRAVGRLQLSVKKTLIASEPDSQRVKD